MDREKTTDENDENDSSSSSSPMMEELKRNAILLGSWIALIRASTYAFGAFQKSTTR